MGGSSSSEKGEKEHDESGVEMTTKKTICTTISGGKHRTRAHHKRAYHTRAHHKRAHHTCAHSKRRTHSRR